MITFWIMVFAIIDLLIAWRYAKEQNICKTVIMCTALICIMISLCR